MAALRGPRLTSYEGPIRYGSAAVSGGSSAFGAVGGVRGDRAAEVGDGAANIHQVVIAEGYAVVEWWEANYG